MTLLDDDPVCQLAERRIRERRELIRRAAASVVREIDAGRRVDPHREAWARQVLATIPAFDEPLGAGGPA